MLKGILVNYSMVTGKSHEAIQNAHYTNETMKGRFSSKKYSHERRQRKVVITSISEW